MRSGVRAKYILSLVGSRGNPLAISAAGSGILLKGIEGGEGRSRADRAKAGAEGVK